MTTLQDIHKFIDLISDKEMNGWFSPEEKDMALHRASMFYFNEAYSSYAINQKAQDDLAPFKKEFVFTNASSPNGLIELPANYQHFLGGWVQVYDNTLGRILYNGFDIANDDELADRLRSQLIPISVEKPVGQWKGKGQIQLWPKTASAGYISYLKYPDEPKFVYILSGRTILYDNSNSTQLEWDEANLTKITFKALSYLGINLDADKLIQYSEALGNDKG